MAQSLVRATCRCTKSLLARPALYSATASPLRRNFASSPASRDEPLPWFVDPSSLPAAQAASPKLATAPVPTPPPAHLDQHLHPLHNHLSISPFLDKQSLVYINAREADPESTWVDWVVVASLRKGREGGLRGAIEGVRTFLAANPIDASPSPPPSAFAPPSSSPLITGIPTPPSKHARSRQASPSRAEQASGWAMLDAGNVVVHVMTEEARPVWGIEEMWRKIGEEGEKERAAVQKMLQGEQLSEDEMQAVRVKEEQEGEGFEEMTEAELRVVREREGKKVYDE